jgi:hypothetical protein
MIIAFKTVGGKPIVLRGKSRKAIEKMINVIDRQPMDEVIKMFGNKDELIIGVVGYGETYEVSPGFSVCNTDSFGELIKNVAWKIYPKV